MVTTTMVRDEVATTIMSVEAVVKTAIVRALVATTILSVEAVVTDNNSGQQ